MIDRKKLGWFVFLAFLSIALDQCLKFYILELASNNNPIFKSEIIDIVLVFNRGVAFSLGSILGDYLKWIILAMLCFMLFIIFSNREYFDRFYLPFALIIGSGASNLIDRFIHNGVVDYVYWHYGFRFAIFNLADSIINLGIAYIIIIYICEYFRDKRRTNA